MGIESYFSTPIIKCGYDCNQIFLWGSLINCNAYCIFCLLEARKESHHFIKVEFFRKLVTKLREIGVFEIEFTYGESFLHSQIDTLFEIAFSNHFSVSVTSNGIFVPFSKIEGYLKNCKLSLVRISLHEATPETHDQLVRRKGTFDKCV